jgi:transcriptional regulator with XRE-family HTH domain
VAASQKKKLSRSELRTPIGKFANRLSWLLSERGWDSHKLSEASGLAEPTIRRWLRAEVLPSRLEMYQAIGHALDIPGHPFPDWRMVFPESV